MKINPKKMMQLAQKQLIERKRVSTYGVFRVYKTQDKSDLPGREKILEKNQGMFKKLLDFYVFIAYSTCQVYGFSRCVERNKRTGSKSIPVFHFLQYQPY